MKKIGVLTSGGDCSGLNAAIRAIIKKSVQMGWEIYGILSGTAGLMEQPVRYLKLGYSEADVNLLRSGGTILFSNNKGDPFCFPEVDGKFIDKSDDIIRGYHSLDLDALIVIGGDGSMKILDKIVKKSDINLIGIPKTIDNDVPFTEFAIGHLTAVQCVVDALERLHDTGLSHQRLMFAEVMGRDSGHIALAAGIAAGVDIVLIPEIPYDLKKVAEKILDIYYNERSYVLVVCAEGGIPIGEEQRIKEKKPYLGVTHYVANVLAESTGLDPRVTTFGHLQRGGSPCALDRIIASAFGVRAVELIAEGKSNRVLAWSQKSVIDVSIDKITSTLSNVDAQGRLVQTAKGLGIYFGD